eukprot:scaffold12202_cov61-Phaeocystis_antarctica.AAC.5
MGVMQFYKQRVLPSQAGHSRRAVHPTRVGLMRTSEWRALPSQARPGKRAAHPYPRVGVCDAAQASQQRALCRCWQSEASEQRTPREGRCVMRYAAASSAVAGKVRKASSSAPPTRE